MSNVDIITSKIINELTPLLNEKVNNHLKEQFDYKLKYENLIKKLRIVFNNSSIKETVNVLIDEINENNFHDKEKDNITLEINEKKEHLKTQYETISDISDEVDDVFNIDDKSLAPSSWIFLLTFSIPSIFSTEPFFIDS